jgi:hypothetical protein
MNIVENGATKKNRTSSNGRLMMWYPERYSSVKPQTPIWVNAMSQTRNGMATIVILIAKYLKIEKKDLSKTKALPKTEPIEVRSSSKYRGI